IGDVVVGLLDAIALLVEQPAVIAAAKASSLGEAIGEIGAAVCAVPVDEAERSATVAVKNEVLAEQPDRANVGPIHLNGAADRMPVTAQQRPHRRVTLNLCQQLVFGFAQHR